MGEVYRARDDRLGREVAIKILPASFAADADRLRRFEQEARAAGALNHPNILAIYDTGTENGAPFVVSELLEGETLRDHLTGGALSHRRATDYGLQLASGLAAAHEKAIVHRDLKPENIFITSDGRVKILDFGLAKLTERTRDVSASTSLAPTRVDTEPGTVMGTVGYMSPEQVRGQPTDHRSDIFSMGVVLYEMLSGKRLFRGDSAVETMNAILKEEPPALGESGQTISPGLQRIVDHCLEKSPASRFQSARDLAFALEALSGSSLNAAASHPGALMSPARSAIRARLPWMIAFVTTIGLMASLPLAIGYLRGMPSEPQAVRFAIPLPEKATAPYFDVVTNSLSVSPDGRYLAFVAISEGQRKLWLRPINALTPQMVPGSDGARGPFWSPDSRSIGFFAGGKLKRVEASGTSPQTICTLSGENENTGTWGRGGVIIYRDRINNEDGLFRVAASGGMPALLTKRTRGEGGSGLGWPHFLPDARHYLIYFGNEKEAAARGIYVASLDSNETKLVVTTAPTQMAYAAGYLLYAREGSIVAQPFDAKTMQASGEPLRVVESTTYFDKTGWSGFSVSENGVLAYTPELQPTQLVWVDRNGRETGQVGPSGLWDSLRISADGRRLALQHYDRHVLSGEIWIHELERGTSTRFALGPADNGGPVWSPDGKRIAFFRCCDAPSTLRIKDVADPGTGSTPLQPGFQYPVDWSQDGRFILFVQSDSTGDTDLWILPMQGDGKAARFLQTPFQEADARFSPDGRWVAYSSTETSREEIYVTRFDRPGEKWGVSREGGRNPRWRRDGKELFFLSANNDIMAAGVKLGDTFDSGTPSALFRSDAIVDVDWDISADGQRFIVGRAAETQTPPFALVVNWTADLKR
jgi:eukaryotic-like serine/threonine-protein kinase